MPDKVFLDVSHQFQGKFCGENTGVLSLVLLEDIGLYRTAHAGQGTSPDFPVFFLIWLPAILIYKQLLLLLYCGIEEHGEDNWCGPIDGHRNRCFRVAKIKAVIQHLHILQGGDGNP